MSRMKVASAVAWLIRHGTEALGHDYPPGCLTREEVDATLRRELRALLDENRKLRAVANAARRWRNAPTLIETVGPAELMCRALSRLERSAGRRGR